MLRIRRVSLRPKPFADRYTVPYGTATLIPSDATRRLRHVGKPTTNALRLQGKMRTSRGAAQLIAAQLDAPDTSWQAGAFGAIAEFHRNGAETLAVEDGLDLPGGEHRIATLVDEPPAPAHDSERGSLRGDALVEHVDHEA